MKCTASIVQEVKSVYQAFVSFARLAQKLAGLVERLKTSEDPKIINEVSDVIRAILDLGALDKITKIYEFFKQRFGKKAALDRQLVRLANVLDDRGLHIEADRVDAHLRKEAAIPVLLVLKVLYNVYTFYRLYQGMRGDLQKVLNQTAKLNREDFKSQKDYIMKVLKLFVDTFTRRGFKELISGQFPGIFDAFDTLGAA